MSQANQILSQVSQYQFTQGLTQPTQELDESAFESLSTHHDESIWGHLNPRTSFFKMIELKKGETYTFGRGAVCSVVFEEQPIFKDQFLALSNVHFLINRKPVCSYGEKAYITDLSANGTYINGEKLGKKRSRLLDHCDTISVLNPTIEVYTYSDAQKTKDSNTPNEVQRQFIIGEELGGGAQGRVHFGINKMTLQTCALKEVKKIRNRNVLNEVHILRRLEHRHIVHMMGHIETPLAVFIIMEHMAGGDLSSLLKERERLQENEAKIVFHQVAQAVDYLHYNKIIHRDLKPENILLRSKDSLYIKLTDFGLSKHNTTRTNADTVCGTPVYAAPEVFKIISCGGSYDAQVDVWSMGILLYVCLSGHQPFENYVQQDRVGLLCKGHHDFSAKVWQVITVTAKTLIREMLMIRPAERISVKNIYRHSWIKQDTELPDQLHKLYLNSQVQF